MSSIRTLSIRKQILFACVAVVAVWICLEGLVLAYWLLTPKPEKHVSFMYRAHPYRAYAPAPSSVSRDGTYSTNSYGLRGPEVNPAKSSDTIRIICLGGSTTLSPGATTDSHTYPAHMERVLREHYNKHPFRIEVLNAGVAAATTMESLCFFQTRLLDFSPDILIIHHAINDMVNAVVYEGFQSDYSYARRPLEMPKRQFWEWSPLLSYFLAKGSVFNPYFPDYNADLIKMINPQPKAVRNPDRQRNKPAEPTMYAAWERNLMSLIHVARGNGVVPVLSTQVFYDDHQKDGHIFKAVDQCNHRMREIARRESIGLIDFDAEIDWSAKIFSDTCHLKDVRGGLDRKGEIFARRLIALGTIERAYNERAGARER